MTALLFSTWLVILFWQRVEHLHFADRLRESLADRAQVMSASMDIMLRAMRQFGGAISDSRLQTYLDELVNSRELVGVALVNRSMAVIAESGATGGVDPKELAQAGELWADGRASFLHAVDLGISTFGDKPRPREAFILPPPGEWPWQRSSQSDGDDRLRQTREELNRELRSLGATNLVETNLVETNATSAGVVGAGTTNGAVSWTRSSRRFPWRGVPMSEERRAEMLEKYGVYGAIFHLATGEISAAIDDDLWLRTIIVGFAFLAVAAAGLALFNQDRSEEIRSRLLRARVQNKHLAEMNLAAAGLAHETRNPLNLIRGMAQMITRDDSATETVRSRCADMIAEVDRVTGQLNEFINYSKPPDVQQGPVRLAELIDDVARPLSAELEDFGVTLKVDVGAVTVVADAKMLRQVIFNLLLNAVQAMKEGGSIRVFADTSGAGVRISVADDGPGVAPDHREKIFEPYFTTREKEGTGLGLAIVRQIVLAHGWEIEFQPNDPKGAIFRVYGMKPANS